jgi:hypothetical protein
MSVPSAAGAAAAAAAAVSGSSAGSCAVLQCSAAQRSRRRGV